MIKVPFDDVFNTPNFITMLRSQTMSIDGHGEADSHISLGGQTSTNAANRNQKLRFDDSTTCVSRQGIYDDRLRNSAACSNGTEMRLTGGDAVDATTGVSSGNLKIYKVNEDLTVTALVEDVLTILASHTNGVAGHVMMSDLINCFYVGGTSTDASTGNADHVKWMFRFKWDDTVTAFSQGLELRQTSGTSCIGHNGTEGIIWRSQGGGAATTTAEIFHPEFGANSRLEAELTTTFPEGAGMSACSDGTAAYRCDGYDVATTVEVKTVRSIRYDDTTTAVLMTNTLAYDMRQQFTASDGRSMMSAGGRNDATSTPYSSDTQSMKFDDSASGIQHTNGLALPVRTGAVASI